MKSVCIAFSIVIISIHFVSAQMQFQHLYGSQGGFFELNHLQKTFDGGYAMIGYVIGTVATGEDICLLKTDSLGFIQWNKIYSSAANESGYYVAQTADSGFIISGIHDYPSSSGCIIMKTDGNGNLLWSSRFQSPGYALNKIIQTPDGGFITNIPELVKLDSAGNILWVNDYPVSFFDMQLTGDNHIVCTDFDFSSQLTYISKIDSGGNVLWFKNYDFGAVTYSYRIMETTNSDLIIAGVYDPNVTNMYDDCQLLARFDSAGNNLWARAYRINSDDNAYDVVETPDSGLVFCGKTSTGSLMESILVKTDAAGIPVWTKRYSSPGNNYLFRSVLADNTGITAGGSESGALSYSFHLVRTTFTGNSGCNEFNDVATDSVLNVVENNLTSSITHPVITLAPLTFSTSSNVILSILCNNTISLDEPMSDDIEIYPSPATEYVRINTVANPNSIVEIFDIHGNLVLSADAKNKTELIVDVSFLEPAVYLIRIFTEYSVYHKKVIVQ